MPIPSLRKIGRFTWTRTKNPLGCPRTLPLSYKPTTSQIADLLGFEPRTPWLTAKSSTIELQVQAELKQRKNGQYGWQDSNLRPPHPKCGTLPTTLHPYQKLPNVLVTPPYHVGRCRNFPDSFRWSLFIVSSRMSKTEVGIVCLPHHKGRESFSIHQILMKISCPRFSASVELLTMSKNSVRRVVRSHCKCRKDFLIHQIFWRIFSCWL